MTPDREDEQMRKDVEAIAALLPFGAGKSKRATIDFLRLILAHQDVVAQLSDAVRNRKTDAELVAVMRKPFLAFDGEIRKKLPRAKSQAEWRNMFVRAMSRVDWDWLARTARVVYKPEAVA